MPKEEIEIRIKPRSPAGILDIRGLIEYRDLLFLLVRRDFVARYKQTVLGPAWAIVSPLVTAFIFAIVFGQVVGVSTDGAPPQLFYLCGLLGWNYFNQTLTATSDTLRGNFNIFSKVYFPRLVTPVATSLSNLVAAGLQLLTFVLIFGYQIATNPDLTNRPSVWSILVVPMLFAHLAVLSLGSGLLLSSLTAKYRDFQQVAPFMVNMLMYVTPVLFPLSQIPEKWRWLATLNPVAPVIETFRSILLGTPAVPLHLYGISILVTTMVVMTGVTVFQRLARNFVDYA